MLQGRPVRVPLVLISAIPRQRDMPDVPFIRKPFDLDYLLRVVNDLLDREADVIN